MGQKAMLTLEDAMGACRWPVLKRALPVALAATAAAATVALAQAAVPATTTQAPGLKPAVRAATAEKPASLVTGHLVTVKGRAYLPLSDLAKALGGAVTCTPDKSRCDITTGATGVLTLNRDALAAFVAERRKQDMLEKGRSMAQGEREGITNIQVTMGGSDVGVRREEEEEHLLLRPSPMMSVEFLGRLLGGQARFDPGTKTWRLPPGDPGCPLAFR